jgi:riboflavin synthase
MFTGIIEAKGILKSLRKEGSNLRLKIEAPFTSELKIDQSVAHNGVCLTVVDISGTDYEVIAIDETLKRSNLGIQREGSIINLERCMRMGDRLDGHMVQGHVDTMAFVKDIMDADGSRLFEFEYPAAENRITVEKGSVCVNGVSLTVVDSGKNTFSVAIIPYTLEHTNFRYIKKGDKVNIEFDVIGKYVAKMLSSR